MIFHPDCLPDLTGKVFIVTGGNSGIGYHTVAHLAKRGAHVYMCTRSLKKGAEAIADIKRLHPSTSVDLLRMDLMDLTSVVAAAKHFLTIEKSLHGLVNNAGVMATPFEMTKDGHEAQWQTNYLAHWVFTELLLPLMRHTSKGLPAGGVRIVNLTSAGHLGAPKCGINFEHPALEESSPWARYGQSKLANILHTRTLHQKYGPASSSAVSGEGEIWVSAVHPGLVSTNLSKPAQESGSLMINILLAVRVFGLMWSADRGSWNSLFCAASLDMKVEQCGKYLEIFGRFGEPWWQSGASKNDQLAEKLDGWTRDVIGQDGWLQ